MKVKEHFIKNVKYIKLFNKIKKKYIYIIY